MILAPATRLARVAELQFYFDFSCPYAYIGSTRVRGVCERAGASLVLKPVLLGGVFRHWERPQDMSANMSPAKARHNVRDMHRWAEHFGVPFVLPEGHPRRTVEALRALLAAPEALWWPLIEALYSAYWVDSLDIGAPEVLKVVLRDVLPGAGLDADALLEASKAPEIKRELWARTSEATDRGVFGVPTFFVGDDMYWGQDRLLFVEATLTNSGAKS